MFEEWWSDLEGYGLRSERCFDELRSSSTVQDEVIVQWMKSCWNEAIKAALLTIKNSKGWQDIDGKWSDPDDISRQVKKLLT